MLEGVPLARLSSAAGYPQAGELPATMETAQRRLLQQAPGDMGDDKRPGCRDRELASHRHSSLMRIIANENNNANQANRGSSSSQSLQHTSSSSPFANHGLDNKNQQPIRLDGNNSRNNKSQLLVVKQQTVKQQASPQLPATANRQLIGHYHHRSSARLQASSQFTVRASLRAKPLVVSSSSSSSTSSLSDKRDTSVKGKLAIGTSSSDPRRQVGVRLTGIQQPSAAARPSARGIEPFESRAESPIAGLTARLKLRAGRQQATKPSQGSRATKDPLRPLADPAVTNSRLRQGLLYARRHQGLGPASQSIASHASTSQTTGASVRPSLRATAAASGLGRQVAARQAEVSITEQGVSRKASSLPLPNYQPTIDRQRQQQERLKTIRQPPRRSVMTCSLSGPQPTHYQQQPADLGRTLSRFSLASSNSSLHTLPLVSVKRAKAEQQQQVGQSTLGRSVDCTGRPRSSNNHIHSSQSAVQTSGTLIRRIRGSRSRRLPTRTLAACSLANRPSKITAAAVPKPTTTKTSDSAAAAEPICVRNPSCRITENPTGDASVNVYLARSTGALPNVEKTTVGSSVVIANVNHQCRRDNNQQQQHPMATMVLSPILKSIGNIEKTIDTPDRNVGHDSEDRTTDKTSVGVDNKDTARQRSPIAAKLPDIPIKTEPITDYYDLEARPFARGKFAQVKKCVNRSTKQCFAAKCIKKRRRSMDMRNDILLEIEALKLSYQSSRIIKLYEVFETSSEIIFVLELAKGGELQRVIDEGELIPEPLVKKMVRQILEGLILLHDSNIAHLDIKPQNLLLTNNYPNGEIKLCDFGISRRITRDCEVREICGTPDYVAPEILGYEPISLATDMWSLGILTYVLLSGYSPFAGETKQETYCNITQAELEFPREIFEATSKDAMDFVRKLLVREPTERPTCREARNHAWLAE